MAADTEPIEILLHLPLLAEDKVRVRGGVRARACVCGRGAGAAAAAHARLRSVCSVCG